MIQKDIKQVIVSLISELDPELDFYFNEKVLTEDAIVLFTLEK